MNVTGTGIAVALAVIVALGFLAFGTPFLAPFTAQAPQESAMLSLGTSTSPTESSMQPMDPGQPLPTELTITDTVVGTGAEATPGSTVSVNYVGALPDGTVFDASANHGGAFSFPLGAGRVIRGWDEGVAGMKVGGKRTLVIPPSYGYGSQDMGTIPPNSTLIFEVELVSVQ